MDSLSEKLKSYLDLEFNSVRVVIESFEVVVNKKIDSFKSRFDKDTNKLQSLTALVNDLVGLFHILCFLYSIFC